MKCDFLRGTYLMSCKAGRHIYVPSSLELGEYCRSSRHKICPLYLKIRNYTRLVGPLSPELANNR
jgi:hypothetical protein